MTVVGMIILGAVALTCPLGQCAEPDEGISSDYAIGVDDVLDIRVLQPEQLSVTLSVAPDGTITFPYVGAVRMRGLSLSQAQEELQRALADGYMKYPIVSVSLRESRSRKFFVYGEVTRPGTYTMEGNVTVLKAISIAGGLTKYGSSSRVKILRPKAATTEYETLKVNVAAAMKGNINADVAIQPGDIIVVSEGLF